MKQNRVKQSYETWISNDIENFNLKIHKNIFGNLHFSSSPLISLVLKPRLFMSLYQFGVVSATENLCLCKKWIGGAFATSRKFNSHNEFRKLETFIQNPLITIFKFVSRYSFTCKGSEQSK